MNSNSRTPDPEPYPDTLTLSELPMPRLSDDAVVQIHDFIHHVLGLFEARYGDQIHRFYEGLCEDSLDDPGATDAPVDPPF